MYNEHRVTLIKIINKQVVTRTDLNSVDNNSLVDDNIFADEWTEVQSPKQHKRSNSNSSTSPINKSAKNQSTSSYVTENHFTNLLHNDPDNSVEITPEAAETPHKTTPPIFIKSQIQNYHAFCENIKIDTEPGTVFSCKSTIHF